MILEKWAKGFGHRRRPLRARFPQTQEGWRGVTTIHASEMEHEVSKEESHGGRGRLKASVRDVLSI